MKQRRRKRTNLGLITREGIRDTRALQLAVAGFQHLERARTAPTCDLALSALVRGQGDFGAMATRVAGLPDIPSTSVRTALLKLKLDVDRTARAVASRCR